jgi:hypothetical protein
MEILGMTKREAQDYCRERGISCAFLETGPPVRRPVRASGKGAAASGGGDPGSGMVVHKVVRAAAAADGSWELLTAPFEDSGIDGARRLERSAGRERR